MYSFATKIAQHGNAALPAAGKDYPPQNYFIG